MKSNSSPLNTKQGSIGPSQGAIQLRKSQKKNHFYGYPRIGLRDSAMWNARYSMGNWI